MEGTFDHNGVVTDDSGAVGTPDTESGIYQARAPYDPIDASILLTNGGYEPYEPKWARTEKMSEREAYKYGFREDRVAMARNEGKDPEDRAHVLSVKHLGNGVLEITRGETPYEARLRLQKRELAEQELLSFHSEIPANPMHSRRVLAYDLAVGAGKSVDDVEFYDYLCRVADWRLPWVDEDEAMMSGTGRGHPCPSEASLALVEQESADIRALIDGTAVYRSKLPPDHVREPDGVVWGGGVVPAPAQRAQFPSLVLSQTRLERRSTEKNPFNPWESA